MGLLNKSEANREGHTSSGSLKKKAMVCSTEAAAISIGIHILLALLAGSVVAIKYVQKRDAAFVGENVSRPKLERRQLQMPVKVQNLQKKSRRPKITTRMASVSKASFSLPDTAGLGHVGGGFDRGGGSRSLSSMGAAGSLGFGISGINFFGVRSKGEKIVFVIDTSEAMMDDAKGGYNTYQFAKEKIHSMVDGMRSATLFNVILYSENDSVRSVGGDAVILFRKNLVPATPENRQALKQWLATVNDNSRAAGKIGKMQTAYRPPHPYESTIESDAQTWLKAVQAGMEGSADNIFVLCAGWGDHRISDEKRAVMFGITDEARKKWLEERGWPQQKIDDWNKERAAISRKAREILAEENRKRRQRGLPEKVVSSMWDYMTKELKLEMPAGPPVYTGTSTDRNIFTYNINQVLEHLDAVYKFNYLPKKLSKPSVHFVQLIAEDAPDSKPAELKTIVSKYRGDCEILRGAKIMENLIEYNNLSAE
jgi:hypothetical protein